MIDPALAFAAATLDRLRRPFGLLLPPFADPGDFRGWPWYLRVVLHVTLLVGVLTILWALSPLTEPQLRWLPTQWMRAAYLPTVFLAAYALCWIGYAMWVVARGRDEFPDLTQDWDRCVAELTGAGYKLNEMPLYLIVGRTNAGDDALFRASGMRLARTLAGKSPVQVYVGTEGVFVVCPGAGAWGAYCDLMRRTDNQTDRPLAAAAMPVPGTIRPDEILDAVGDGAKQEFRKLMQVQSDRALTPDEQTRMADLTSMLERASSRRPAGFRGPPPQLPTDVLTEGPRRMAHLCKLIRRDRRPWCPANGALIVVPWSAITTGDHGRAAAAVLAADLFAARQALGLHYPHILMVCDLELADGFDEFKRGFPAVMLRQRIGQRLPLVPDAPATAAPAMLVAAADTIRANLLASWVFKFLRLEWPPDARKTTTFVPNYNRNLFRFLHALTMRGPGLATLLSEGLPIMPDAGPNDPAGRLPLCGGCYLAATGPDDQHQAFVPGVFQRLAEGQSLVSWTPESVAADARYRQWARVLMLTAGGLLAATAVMIYRALR